MGATLVGSNVSFTTTANGTFNFIYTLNGCTDTVALIVNQKPNAGSNISGICGGTTQTLSATPTGGTWSAQSGNPVGATLVGSNASFATTANGTFNFTYALNGCTDTIAVAVRPSSSSTTTIIRCSNQLPFVWNGINRTTAGTYTFSTTNSVGCDSIATLVLVVRNTSSSSSNVTICNTQLPYLWNGINRTTPGTYTFTTTNAAGCDSLATLVLTVTNCTAICKAGFTAPCLSSSYVCADNTTKRFDLTSITLNCTKPDSTILEWHTGNPATTSNLVSNPSSVPKGSYWAVYRDTVNNCYGNNGFATQNVSVDTCSNSVTSGGGGGIESKTLGNVISQRLYGSALNNRKQDWGRTSTLLTKSTSAIVNGPSDLRLVDLVPSTVLGTDRAYISSPTDLVNFTNADEVLSVDYTKTNINKAVAFGTRTLGDVYNHTKPICDRLKGSEILEIKQISVNGITLLAYKVKQHTG
ncbi:MAG: hypothetical protein ACOVOV_19170, partial [Dolichospermum sp.]